MSATTPQQAALKARVDQLLARDNRRNKGATTPGNTRNFRGDSDTEQLRRTEPFADFPRYEAALQTGLLVICRRCEFYKGPHAKALGWCRKFDTEAAPDVPFTCGAASRA
jgi:hypothetical protein